MERFDPRTAQAAVIERLSPPLPRQGDEVRAIGELVQAIVARFGETLAAEARPLAVIPPN